MDSSPERSETHFARSDGSAAMASGVRRPALPNIVYPNFDGRNAELIDGGSLAERQTLKGSPPELWLPPHTRATVVDLIHSAEPGGSNDDPILE